MKILRTISAHCPKCDRDVEFRIEMCYVEYRGITPCLICPSCNIICPDYAFSDFINTGKIVIGI